MQASERFAILLLISLQKWRELSLANHQAYKAKPKQTQIAFDTQLKTAHVGL